ncbi:hypothetical protein K435DRAFT_862946 [Dendrothele bispora CBS 962.96]|uniref:Uncharacterized protein n=1 Tax=Dendrothele bispora (strain CBS 962.96) TaxID=1314807 RepID=A0A4S8LSQ0_DENBC|nr:hypothetical protein K435DRAFT_862946 [Dendrothele bispora CBS 962.96]
MPFPFTFNFKVPGLSNPFSNPPLPDPGASSSFHSHSNHDDPNADILNIRSNDVHTYNNPTLPNRHLSSGLVGHRDERRTPSQSRKRGWEPSFAEPSQSMPTLASSNGYLDTPAKYREMAEAQQQQYIGNREQEYYDYERVKRLEPNGEYRAIGFGWGE